MNHLLKSMGRRDNAHPDALRALFHNAISCGEIDEACEVVKNPSAPHDLLEIASASKDPSVRAAWLLRPERSIDELKLALGRERRGQVLAAVASAPELPAELIDTLAGLNKRPVALRLIKRAAASGDRRIELSDEAYEQVTLTADASMRSARMSHSQAFTNFCQQSTARLIPLAGKLSSREALEVLLHTEAELDASTQQLLVDRLICNDDIFSRGSGASMWERRVLPDRWAQTLLARSDVDPQVAEGVYQHWSTNRPSSAVLREFSHLGGSKWRELGERIAALETAEPAEAMAVWLECSTASLRGTAAEKLWRNPRVSDEVLIACVRSLAAGTRWNEGELAALLERRAGLSDETLAQLVAQNPMWLTEALQLRGPQRLRTLIVPHLRASDVATAFEQGLLDKDSMLQLSASQCRLTAEQTAWLSDAMAEQLGADPAAWAMADKLMTDQPTMALASVVATARAATA